MTEIIWIIAAYLIGSIPFGLVLSKIFLGVDLRKIGSGNIGTTNVFRTGSKVLTLLTLICDMGKGVLMVALTNIYFPSLVAATAFAVLIGHNFPIFLKFKGGKGFATTFGYFAYFAPPAFFMFGALWILVVLTFSYSALGAITTLILMPFVFWFGTSLPLGIKVFFILTSVLGLARHQSNFKRLFKGTESKTDLSKFIK
ncbi:MAG: glycerol-3-phosphate 1-O-acyltransferase PlsY [Alphaproteobacteria bacterium]|nr:glycerol-3-phosphate 1-O-acyltransferase PlsY [Alphaproteobacteria bacterium]